MERSVVRNAASPVPEVTAGHTLSQAALPVPLHTQLSVARYPDPLQTLLGPRPFLPLPLSWPSLDRPHTFPHISYQCVRGYMAPGPGAGVQAVGRAPQVEALMLRVGARMAPPHPCPFPQCATAWAWSTCGR